MAWRMVWYNTHTDTLTHSTRLAIMVIEVLSSESNEMVLYKMKLLSVSLEIDPKQRIAR